MTATVHLTHFFSTTSASVFDECDRIMAELVRREDTDGTVRDAAVSADAEHGIVEVEVVSDGVDEQDAVHAAVARIRAAVSAVVEIDGAMQQREVTAELVPC
ncbi:hypothetical protein [Janibacter terrae]|uniref:hypothetical protein n=1 Tax=Janibacter terrae TaxID=103817 RepID=UPI0031F95B83